MHHRNLTRNASPKFIMHHRNLTYEFCSTNFMTRRIVPCLVDASPFSDSTASPIIIFSDSTASPIIILSIWLHHRNLTRNASPKFVMHHRNLTYEFYSTNFMTRRIVPCLVDASLKFDYSFWSISCRTANYHIFRFNSIANYHIIRLGKL
jgi:hypothetical protein